MLAALKVRWLSLTIFMDIALTILALLLARWVRGYLPAGQYLDENLRWVLLDEPLYFRPLVLIPLVALIWLVIFASHSVYSAKFNLQDYDQVYPVFSAITGAVLVLAGVAYFFFRDLSRFLFLYFYLFDLLLLIGWRKVAFHLLQNSLGHIWWPQHRVLIVGQGQLAQDVATAIKAFQWSGLELVGTIEGTLEVGQLQATLSDQITKLQVDEIVFALSPKQRVLLQDLVLHLQTFPVNLRLVPDIVDLVFAKATIEDFAGLPLIGLREPALTPLDRLIKRSFDITVAICLLLLTLPFSIVIAALIKFVEGGAIFYKPKRVGEGGRLFTMYKFRTMVEDAEHAETDLFRPSKNGFGLDKQPNDPRVTQLGRFLRRTSFDELPQFVNVLKGDMSLVGPRPELPWLVDHYEAWQYQRFAVPQGMTGWWQVKNRNNQETYDVRVEDDLYYIHNYSFFLDLRILWLTMGALIRGDGAY